MRRFVRAAKLSLRARHSVTAELAPTTRLSPSFRARDDLAETESYSNGLRPNGHISQPMVLPRSPKQPWIAAR